MEDYSEIQSHLKSNPQQLKWPHSEKEYQKNVVFVVRCTPYFLDDFFMLFDLIPVF